MNQEKIKQGTIATLRVLMAGVFTMSTVIVNAQEHVVRYTGETLSNVDYHHGQLRAALGVHAIQVMRANREHPETADGFGWTYNHAPMLAYWNNSFFLQYLSDSVSEHVPPSQTLLLTSSNGYEWSKPKVIFPRYRIPDGTTKEGYDGVARNLYAVMHQRMGFYVSKSNRLLTVAYYGIALDPMDGPNDGEGVGRVVREIYKDGNLGPIYFIRFNSRWSEEKTEYLFYRSSKDKGFVEACEELLRNPLMMQQWVEEADRDDPLIPLKKQYKAFSYYRLPDGDVVGLWKHALTSISRDGGRTWSPMPARAPGFVNGNAKIWGQRTSDGKYVTVYNPSEFRWPLALSTSDDGLNYRNLLLVHGEITPMRYGGNYKSYGPQYVRGILEGNGIPPDGKLWITYSMNKEDIWVATVPVPVSDSQNSDVSDVFDNKDAEETFQHWNVYSPLQASVRVEKIPSGTQCLVLRDADKFDFAKAERIFLSAKSMELEFSCTPAQTEGGILQVELQDSKGTPAVRLIFDSDGVLKTKAGARMKNILSYKANEEYRVKLRLQADERSYSLQVNESEIKNHIFYAPVSTLEKIVFRTGSPRDFPTPETPADQFSDLEDAGASAQPCAFFIHELKTERTDGEL